VGPTTIPAKQWIWVFSFPHRSSQSWRRRPCHFCWRRYLIFYSAFTLNGRNLDLEVNLAAGTYTAFVSANWRHAEYAYNLTFYGSERVDFERVYTEKVPNLISQSLEEINVHNGKRTELNKNSCQYFHYHPQSNLAILTVENTSERDAAVTADLSKVKFDHLVLLTSHNNEDNYSNKVGAEIEEYKQIPLADRRWSVSLAGGHRFTWILATDLPYNEANPKTWGFNWSHLIYCMKFTLNVLIRYLFDNFNIKSKWATTFKTPTNTHLSVSLFWILLVLIQRSSVQRGSHRKIVRLRVRWCCWSTSTCLRFTNRTKAARSTCWEWEAWCVPWKASQQTSSLRMWNARFMGLDATRSTTLEEPPTISQISSSTKSCLTSIITDCRECHW